ncbi:MAG TPA: hypothetical protein VFR93_08805 [Candidatus Limnocylindrales bacterium]|nr:hypothetical protein [Candidatus Limnocylindrales bacterium]
MTAGAPGRTRRPEAAAELDLAAELLPLAVALIVLAIVGLVILI